MSPSISLLSNHHPFERAVGFDLHSLLWNDLFSCKTNWNYMNQLKLLSVRCRFRFKLAIVSVKWMSLKCWLHFKIAIQNLKVLLQNYSQPKFDFVLGSKSLSFHSLRWLPVSLYRHLLIFPVRLLRDCWLVPRVLSLTVVSGWNYLSKDWVSPFR